MIRKKSHIALFFIFTFYQTTPLFSVGKPPILHRACIDNITGIACLYLTPPKDTCSSFKFYRIYGRDNSVNPFQLLNQTTTLNVNSLCVLLPNKKQWEFYISCFYACNGKDSFNSNKIKIDITAPNYVEPDSVSVDMISQQIIGGWTTPSDADIMGYSLFKVDATSGINSLIDEKNVLSYTFATSTFNSSNGGNRLAIAAYDSCKNGGIISAYHSPVLLSYTLPSNYRCSRKITLNWNPYVGWKTDSNTLYIFDLNTKKTVLWKRFDGATTSVTISLPYLNTTFGFLIRSKKIGSTITSSSNIIQVNVPDFPKPVTSTNINFLSVESKGTIDIHSAWQTGDTCRLYYTKSPLNWKLINLFAPPTSNNNSTLSIINSDLETAQFIIIRSNSCGFFADSSLIFNNILLQSTGKTLVWNEFSAWKNTGLPFSYHIEENTGGTWADIGSTNALSFNPTGYGVHEYRIKAIPTTPLNPPNWSNSNSLLLDLGDDPSTKDTTLVPSGFSPEGLNPIFKITNLTIRPGESEMIIFNRWGEMVFKGDALIGWDGNYLGKPASSGLYIYLITAEYKKKRDVFKGTINLLR